MEKGKTDAYRAQGRPHFKSSAQRAAYGIRMKSGGTPQSDTENRRALHVNAIISVRSQRKTARIQNPARSATDGAPDEIRGSAANSSTQNAPKSAFPNVNTLPSVRSFAQKGPYHKTSRAFSASVPTRDALKRRRSLVRTWENSLSIVALFFFLATSFSIRKGILKFFSEIFFGV
ncbi:MAG: hypothetical protein IJU03_07075 [Thermoguttaceae bacterium]|nr:hypothetical protein [Thermoguttaceae bacterium]